MLRGARAAPALGRKGREGVQQGVRMAALQPAQSRLPVRQEGGTGGWPLPKHQFMEQQERVPGSPGRLGRLDMLVLLRRRTQACNLGFPLVLAQTHPTHPTFTTQDNPGHEAHTAWAQPKPRLYYPKHDEHKRWQVQPIVSPDPPRPNSPWTR